MRGDGNRKAAVHLFVRGNGEIAGNRGRACFLRLCSRRRVFLSVTRRGGAAARAGKANRGVGNQVSGPMRETKPIEGRPEQKGNSMGGLWILLVVIGVWILLQAVILPKLGIST